MSMNGQIESESPEAERWPSGQRTGLWPRLLRKTFGLLERLLARTGRSVLLLEYPPSAESGPRHGHGKPAHPKLQEIINANREGYRGHLEAIGSELATLSGSGAHDQSLLDNIWLSGLDGASLYHFVASRKPSRYIEIGSGMSTRWAHLAIREGNLPTTITSIDPSPRAEIEDICDVSVRAPFESADIDMFKSLEEGDIVFMDGSHRTFTNSDATVFMLDVLPTLPSGVLVGIHDILLPLDYPPEWTSRFYSEQYLLAAYLLGGAERVRIELPCHFITDDPELSSIWAESWRAAGLDSYSRYGQAFWISIT